MKKCLHLLNLTIILTMLMGFFAVPVAADEAGPGNGVIDVAVSDGTGQYANYSRTQGAPKPSAGWTAKQMEVGEVIQGDSEKGTGVYIIQLLDAPLALYTGGVPGLAATNPATAGNKKLDANSTASLAYRSYLGTKRVEAIRAVNKTLGRELNIKFEYEAAINGFAAEMSAQEAAQLEQLPQVWRVDPERMEYILTDAGPWWIGANGIWDGSGTGMAGARGEGIIVGIIDTGIDPWNPSFADVGGDGYDHNNPWGSGTYVGVCDPANTLPPAGVVAYDPTFPCNDKVIGVWGYTIADPNPRDGQGHGSHVASTAAGNVTYNTTITMANGLAFSNDISGVAPHANIISYDACRDNGGCPSTATSKAIDQAILDGVDVVNYSIGLLRAIDPWTDAESLMWLAVREAGIQVAIAAGNDGPGPETVGEPAVAPWVTSVGNLTHNRAYINTLVLTNSNPLSDSIELVGLAMTGGMVQAADIVYSIDYANPPIIEVEDARLCGMGDPNNPDNPFPPGTFNGEIVVCERGIYPRVSKSQFVFEAGAGGFVLAQPTAVGGGLGARVADPHILPSLHIDYDSYQQLKVAVASGYDMGIILGSERVIDPIYADIMAAGSSRGPNNSVPDLIAPSVAAPGSSIWAAHRKGATDGDYTYNMIGGTSMASPHVAGTYALLRELQPGWNPAEAQSAVMLTADTTVVDDDAVTPATPFDMGSGRVQASMAAKAGFVLDITVAEYTAADPNAGGDPKQLNTASMANSQCAGVCSWERTLSSTMTDTVTWTASYDAPPGVDITVTPAQFSLAADGDQVIDIEMDVSAITGTDWVFGSVTFMPDNADTVPAHMPIAVIPVQFITPTDQYVVSERNAGGKVLPDLLSKLEIPNLTGTMYGLQQPDIYMINLDAHGLPTTDFPEVFFTDTGNVGVVPLSVPADAIRVVAEILDTTSPDLDMLLLYDENGSGQPELTDTEGGNFCQSAAGGPYEYCSVMEPPAGDWFLLIINYKASTAGQPDPITLGTAILDADAGNLALDNPGSVPQGTPYTATVLFDEMMAPGETWYGAVALSTDTGEAPFGSFAFDVHRVPDVVNKDGPVGVFVGESATYTITVDSNILYDVPLNYMITDTLPSGMTLVPGSAAANFGVVSEVGSDTILWQGTMDVSIKEYVVTDSNLDPTCGTPFGGYFDTYSNYGFETQPGLAGDTIKWSYTSLGTGTEFYGESIQKPYFTDDGFSLFADDNAGTGPKTNQDLPDPTAPNGIAAQYWRDMEIIYSPVPTNAGITGVSWGVFWMVEFDNAQVYGDPTQTLDYEIFSLVEADPTPGTFDIMYAFDNVNISDSVGTVGIEDPTGAIATQYAYDDFTPTNGLVVCLDWVFAGEPAVITYQAMVDTSITEDFLTNTVVHDNDMVGTKPESTSYSTTIYTAKADWTKEVSIGHMVMDYTVSPIAIYENQWPKVIDTVSVTSTQAVSFTMKTMSSGVLSPSRYEVSAGMVTDMGDVLVWEIPESTGVVGTQYVFTTTYRVDKSDILTGMVMESLDLQRGVPEDDRTVEFNVVRVDKLARSRISPGITMSYKLVMSNALLVDTFAISDTMPAGVSYAGNLVETGGLAVYDAGGDVVMWTSPLNVIGDPSFEDAATGTPWSEGGDFAGPICSAAWCVGVDNAITGDYYLWFGGWGATNMSYVAQTVTIPEADEAVLSFWLLIDVDPSLEEIVLEVEIDGELVAVYTEEDALTYSTYGLVSIDVSRFADGTAHELVLQGTEIGATYASAFVDDVSIVAGKPVTSQVIEARWDVDVTGSIGDVINNVAEVDLGFRKYTINAETDILSIFWLPRVTRGYPSQP